MSYDQWKTSSPYDDPMYATVYVMLPCTQDRVPETEVKFLNIEEDMQGRDLLTYTCPECGKEHKSYRIG